MKVTVYVKSAVDLTGRFGAFAYTFWCGGDVAENKHQFKVEIKTLTMGDCAAAVNAMHYLAKVRFVEDITEIELFTDSGKIKTLIDTYKGEKHCEETAVYWRDTCKPKFKSLQVLNVVKLSKKARSITNDNFRLQRCYTLAKGELELQRSILS